MINPLWLAALRRKWPLAGATVVFLVFLLVHGLFFSPTADRYQSAVKDAQQYGLQVEPAVVPEVIPPRVYALLAGNAMPARTAKEEGESGALSASLIEAASRIASRRGMEIVVTEPAPTSQLPHAVIVRTRMRVRTSYAGFTGFLEDLAAHEHLLAVDRFALQPAGGGTLLADLHLSRYILKQSQARP
jgi:hypothetical protein